MIFTSEFGFNSQDEFYNKGRLNRLNSRYKAFIDPIKSKFKGARVLDLGSHDGRWTYASLHAGAEHVTGIEFRSELIAKADNHLNQFSNSKYIFIQDDICSGINKVKADKKKFDIVLCLGVFYHIMEHERLIRLLASLRADTIILDSTLLTCADPVIWIDSEDTQNRLHTPPRFPGQQFATIGIPSRTALIAICKSYDLNVQFVDWEALELDSREKLDDYFSNGPRRRFTAYLSPETDGR